MPRIVGSGVFQIGASLAGIQQEINAKLAKVRATKDVRLTVDTRLADAQIRAFTNRPRQDIKIGVRTDEKGFKDAEQRFRRLEVVYKKSAISRAIRVNVTVAGAALLPALAQGALSAATALTELGQSALLLPGIFSAMGASIGTLLVGLNGLGAAFQAAGRGTKNAAGRADEFAKSARDLEKAQRDVAKALKDANRELEDQGDALRGTFLDQEQAAINVAKAKEALKAGGGNYTDYRQRVLDLNVALREQATANREAGRTTTDAYETLSKGATGSDQYKDSIDALKTAVEQFTENQKKASGVTDEFIAAMDKLGPEAQDFVNKVRSLEGAWGDLTKAVSGDMLRGLGDSIVDLARRRLPQLQSSMQGVATQLNGLFKDVLGNIGNDANFGNIQKIFANTAEFIKRATPGINSFVDAFLQLSEVGSRFLPRLADAFSGLMGRFENFTARASADGSIERWIDKGLNVIGKLFDSIKSIGSILNSVTEAYEKATGNIGGFATTLADGLGSLATFLKSAKGQSGLVSYIKQGREFLGTIREALPGIISAFQAFGAAARDVATVLFPIFAKVGEFMKNNATLVQGLIAAYLAWRGLFKPIANGMGNLYRAANKEASIYRENLAKTQRAQEALMGRKVGPSPFTPASGGLRQQALMDKVNSGLAAQNFRIASAEAVSSLNAMATAQAKVDKLQAQNVKDTNPKMVKAQTALTTATDDNAKAQARVNEAYNNNRSAQVTATNNMNALRDASANAAGPKGIGRLRSAIGSAANGLIGGLSGLIGTLGTAAVIGGVIYAITEWQAVNSEAADQVDRHTKSIQDLSAALDGAGGAATEATRKKATELLQDSQLTGTGNGKGPTYGNTLDTAQKAGIDPFKLTTALATGDSATVDALLKPVEDKVKGGLTDSGFTGDRGFPAQDELLKALSGDPAAVEAFKQRSADSLGFGSPELNNWLDRLHITNATDLNDIRQQLPPDLKAMAQFLEAARTTQRDLPAARSLAQQQNYAANGPASFKPGVPNPFGPNADVSASGGGAATVSVPDALLGTQENPSQLAKNIEEQGGQIDWSRLDGKKDVFLKPDRAGKYVQFKADGGEVWGRGSATSDSIPAMLSNGEFVINAKSASVLGMQNLHQLNNADKFAKGGPVGFAGGGGWFKVPPIPPKGLPTPGSGQLSNFQPGGVPNRRGVIRSDTAAATTSVPDWLIPKGVPGTGPAGIKNDLPEWLKPKALPDTEITTLNPSRVGTRVYNPANRVNTPTSPIVPGVGNFATQGLGGVNPAGLAPLRPKFQHPLGPALAGAGAPKPAPLNSDPAIAKKLADQGLDHFGKPLAAAVPTAGSSPAPPTSTVHRGAPTGSTTGALPGPSPVIDGLSIPTFDQLGVDVPAGPSRAGNETGLQRNTVELKRAVESAFPEITDIGGVRADALKWHPDGLALDVMLPNGLSAHDPEGKALGDKIWAWAQTEGPKYGLSTDPGVNIWNDGGAHDNHLHLVSTGGGAVTGDEQFFAPSGLGSLFQNSLDRGTFTGGIPGLPGGEAQGFLPGPDNGSQGFNYNPKDDEISGPYGPLPFKPKEFAKNLGEIAMSFVGGFFGIDFSQITDVINGVSGGLKDQQDQIGSEYVDNGYLDAYASGQMPAYSDAEAQQMVKQLTKQAAEAKANGDKEGAEQLLDVAKQIKAQAVKSRNAASSLAPGRAGGGAEQWRPAVRDALTRVAGNYGITNIQAWEDALVTQIDTESKGNPGADNPNDSNGQGGSQHVSGLLQFLPSTFAAHNITGGDYTDPQAQIYAAIDYVKSTYGMNEDGSPKYIGQGHGYAGGGLVGGAAGNPFKPITPARPNSPLGAVARARGNLNPAFPSAFNAANNVPGQALAGYNWLDSFGKTQPSVMALRPGTVGNSVGASQSLGAPNILGVGNAKGAIGEGLAAISRRLPDVPGIGTSRFGGEARMDRDLSESMLYLGGHDYSSTSGFFNQNQIASMFRYSSESETTNPALRNTFGIGELGRTRKPRTTENTVGGPYGLNDIRGGKSTREHIANIDSAMAQSPELIDDMILYSRTANRVFRNGKGFIPPSQAESFMGKQFINPGFLSTSIGNGVMPLDPQLNPYLLEILARSGTKGVYLGGHDIGKGNLSQFGKSEQEFLLPRDSVLTPVGQRPHPDYPGTSIIQAILEDQLTPRSLPGHAKGGFISGPGGPTADRIPAMLSDGEFVIRNAAVKAIGVDRLAQLNRLSGGGTPFDFVTPLLGGAGSGTQPPGPLPLGPPPGPPPSQSPVPPPAAGPAAGLPAPVAPGPAPLASPSPQVPGVDAQGTPLPDSGALVQGITDAASAASTGVAGSQPGAAPSPGADGSADPRATLGAQPESTDHLNPGLRAGIEGAASTIGSLAATAAAVGSGGMGGQAAGAGIQAGAQIAGQAASGIANVIASLAVGTLSGGTTGQGYGAPLLPQQAAQSPVRQFAPVQNNTVNVQSNNDWLAAQKRMDAQQAAGYMNRVP